MESTSAHVRKSKTLFIRNLPFSTTNEKLEGAFSEIGPIKQCFVVKNKDSEKCKGYGYVTFSLFDDADKAKEKIKSLDGRKLYISYADRKRDEKKKKKAEVSNDREEKVEDSEEEKEETEDKPEPRQDDSAKKSHQESKYLQAKTLVVTGLKDDFSTDALQNCLQSLNVKNVAKFEFPVSGRDVPTAFVRFKCVRDTKRGQRRLDGSNYKGMKLKAVQLNKETIVVPQKELKKARIIIRNLSFKCTVDLLEKTFNKFGNISEVKIPQKPDGRVFGFGFVQFTDVSAASKAIQQMNTKPVLGRPVAVDWAVPKDKFQAAKSTPTTETDDLEESESDEGSFSASNDEASEGESEDTEGDDDNEEENESSDEGFDDRNSTNDESDVEDSENDSDNEDSEFSDDVADIEKKSKSNKGKKCKPTRKSDVEEGRTLFIRNLSYDTEEDTLSECMSKYGKVNYCRLVVDKHTEHPKGTAFIQFKKKEDADKCLQEANDESQDGGIKLDSRKLSIAVAVNRDTAVKFNEKKEKEKTDRRNLHLAREGIIRAGTQAAQGLTKDDLAKRMKVEMLKRQKLKNPNIFVSSTRLCIRNLPTNVDEKQLKKIYLNAAENKSASITECRIMRDQARVNGQGVAKSRGFGFINFTDHQDALQALRYTNNNPDLFGEKKRLIVEFSLENKAALVAKEKRMDRIKTRQESLKKNKSEEVQERNKKDNFKNKNKKQSLSDKFIGQTVITKEKGKSAPKTLSSHWGPKIRHKKRPSQIENEKKQKKIIKNKNLQEKKRKIDRDIQSAEFEGPSKKKKKQKEKKDAFDDLVSNYKKKILSAQTAQKKSKWFR